MVRNNKEVYKLSNGVNIYTKEAFYKIQDACSLLKEVRDTLVRNAIVGITTMELERIAESEILRRGCEPLFKGFEGFPCCTCMSNNEFIVHGIPNDKPLMDGDVLSIDVGLKYKGYCADSARTVIVGKNLDINNSILVDAGKECFYSGLEKAVPGNTVGDIGFNIFKRVSSYTNTDGNWRSGYKFKIFKSFRGHGIGLDLHEEPFVPNTGSRGAGPPLLEGMCICIEPVVINQSSEVISFVKDGVLQFITNDRKPSVHYENQVFISSSGPIVLT